MTSAAIGSLALVGIGMLVLIAVALVPRIWESGEGALGPLMRLTAVSAVCAVASALMYVAYAVGGTLISLALGDALMVLAPALLWCAIRQVNGRSPYSPVVAAAAAVAMAVTTVTTPGWFSSGIKVVLAACACLLMFVETRRRPVSTLRASSPLAGISLLYAAFSFTRVGVALFAGEESELYQRAFTSESVAAVNGLATVGCGVAVLMLRRELVPDKPTLATASQVEQLGMAVLAQGQTLTAYTVELPEMSLIRAAHGAHDAREMRDALARSINAADPGLIVAESRSGDSFVALSVTPSDTSVADRIRTEHLARAPIIDGADRANVVVKRHIVTDDGQLRAVMATLGSRARIWQTV